MTDDVADYDFEVGAFVILKDGQGYRLTLEKGDRPNYREILSTLSRNEAIDRINCSARATLQRHRDEPSLRRSWRDGVEIDDPVRQDYVVGPRS